MSGVSPPPAAGPSTRLTPREAEVLRYVSLRLTNREIGERLVLSTRTVESHVSSLLAKLGATTRRELAELGAGHLAARSILPVARDGTVGRDDDLTVIGRLIGAHRLVTLTGPPGVGKTRLATEAARALPAGTAVRVVELGPARGPESVADRLLVALGGRQLPGQDATAAWTTTVVSGPVLVLMDDCERVLSAAAAAVEGLLASHGTVRVLATSREPLGVDGEVVRPVAPLAVPAADATLEEVLGADAVRLLVERSAATGAGLSVHEGNAAAVARLCRSLDGLPLALELLAGRLRAFTPEQLVDRLDDTMSLLSPAAAGGPRRRSLRQAIASSYDALSEVERDVFRGLAVFPASFTLEAAEAVCAPVGAARDIDMVLARLVDRSLVHVVPAGAVNRYRLLDTLRGFARERLPADHRTELMARHAAYVGQAVEDAEARLHGPAARPWREQLRALQDDVAVALEWSLRHDGDLALRIVGAMPQFWEDTDQRRTGIDWAERALAAGVGDARVRLKALLAAATLVAPWDFGRGSELVDEAYVLAAELDEPLWWALTHAAAVKAAAYAPGQPGVGDEVAQRALTFFAEAGDAWNAAEVLTARSLLQSPREAVTTLAEARRLYEQVGDELRAANVAYMTASFLARDLGDVVAAAQLAEQVLAVSLRGGHEHEAAHARSILAEVALHDGSTQRAAELATECLAVFRRAADHRCASAMLLVLGRTAILGGDVRAARSCLEEVLTVARLGAHTRTVPLARAALAEVDERERADAAQRLRRE